MCAHEPLPKWYVHGWALFRNRWLDLKPMPQSPMAFLHYLHSGVASGCDFVQQPSLNSSGVTSCVLFPPSIDANKTEKFRSLHLLEILSIVSYSFCFNFCSFIDCTVWVIINLNVISLKLKHSDEHRIISVLKYKTPATMGVGRWCLPATPSLVTS